VQPSIFAAQEQIMRKLFVIALALSFCSSAISQDKKQNIVNRAGDHFMFQIASNFWMNTPDSIDNYLKGFNRSANVYLMFDKPFKGDPRFSVGIGAGVGTTNMYFKKMIVDIGSVNPILPFTRADSGNHYKKFKVSTAFVEVPVELRFTANPDKPMKSFKIALGAKVGTMLSAKSKGKILQDKNDQNINTFTQKTITKAYFNTTKLAATARIGYGNFSLFGAYNFTTVFKDGVAAEIKAMQIGLTISGL
jgi:hypothetical protein